MKVTMKLPALSARSLRRMLAFGALLLLAGEACAAGLAGTALHFDGSVQTVRMPASPSLDLGGAFTIEAWVYPESISNLFPRVVDREQNTNSRFTLALQNSNQSFNSAINGVDLAASEVVPLNTWSHLAVSYDGATAKLYFNGQPVAEAGLVESISAGAADLILGNNRGNNRQFLGVMDEVRIWNVSRSEAEMAFWHNRLIPLDATGLVSYWNFNENVGSTLLDRVGDNDGAINGPAWVDSTAPLIPEPSTYALLLSGLAVVFGLRCSRRSVAHRGD